MGQEYRRARQTCEGKALKPKLQAPEKLQIRLGARTFLSAAAPVLSAGLIIFRSILHDGTLLRTGMSALRSRDPAVSSTGALWAWSLMVLWGLDLGS